MADSKLTATINDQWSDGKRLHVIGTIAVAAGDYAAGGIPGLLTAARKAGVQSSDTPLRFRLTSHAGYLYTYEGGKLKAWQGDNTNAAAAPAVELPAAATPAAVVADAIDFYAIFKALV